MSRRLELLATEAKRSASFARESPAAAVDTHTDKKGKKGKVADVWVSATLPFLSVGMAARTSRCAQSSATSTACACAA